MPHALTIDHEGNTWLTDQATHQVGTETSCTVLRSLHTGQRGVGVTLRPVYTGDFCRIKFQTCSKPLRYRGDKSH